MSMVQEGRPDRRGTTLPVAIGLTTILGVAALVVAACAGGSGTDTAPPQTPAPTSESATLMAPTSSFAHRAVVVSIPEAAPDRGPAEAAPAPGSPAADGPSGAGTDARPYVPQDSIDTLDKRLNVTLDGETIYIRNGGRVELGDGLAVEILLDPYPPTTLHAVMDLYLTRHGEPLSDGSVGVEFDMLAMAHGPFVADARKIGQGHHLVTLDYIMFGPWDQTVTVRIGLERIRIPIVIVARP